MTERLNVSMRRMRQLHFLATLAVAVTVLAGVLTFVVAPIRGSFIGDMEDLGTRGGGPAGGEGIIGGARQASRGLDPYQPFLGFVPTHKVISAPFDYPPIVVWLMRPMTGLSQHAAETLWLWLGLASLVAGASIVAWATLPSSWPRLRVAVVAALTFPAATFNLYHGNVNPIVFVCVSFALLAWVRGWEVRCGVALGVAASLKIAPAALLILFIKRRWWRGTCATAITGVASLTAAALLVSGPVVREFILQVTPLLNREDGWFLNQSAAAVISRLFDHSIGTVDQPSVLIRVLVVGSDIGLLSLAACAVTRSRVDARTRVAEFGLGIAAMLLAGATTWYPRHIDVLIILAAAVMWLMGTPDPRRTLAAATAFLVVVDWGVAPVFLSVVAPALNLDAVHLSWLWWPFVQLTSLPAVAVLVMYGALLTALRHSDGMSARTR